MCDGFFMSSYVVDLEKLKKNVLTIKGSLKYGVKFCAVVKANAYGVGSVNVCKAISNFVDVFAVANLAEGIKLRKSRINNRILVLGPVNIEKIKLYQKYNLEISVNSKLEILKLSKLLKKSISVHLKINSGMNRLGFNNEKDLKDCLKIIVNNSFFRVVGVYSHFATKESDVCFMEIQHNRFKKMLDIVKDYIMYNFDIHICNSSACIYHKDLHYTMVRVGMGLYGIKNMYSSLLDEVVSVKSVVSAINIVEAGESVGYDRTFVANSKMIVGVVPLGYYDGIDRRLSNSGFVLVGGKRVPIIGRVCMDMFMIDLTRVRDVCIGDEVVVIGKQEGEFLSVSDMAKAIDESEYAVLTGLNYRRMNYILKR